MKVTNKDDLRVGDEARFVHGKSALQGPIRALTQGADGGPIISVTIEGFEHSITIHDHAARGSWLWAFDGAERPVPEPEVGQTGTARINYLEIETAGARGTWVLRSDGGDELVFAVHRPVGSTVRVPRTAVSNFQPDPDYRAAVDAYARHVRRIRAAVGFVANEDLLAVIDDGPKL